jgi:hypothetical protein
MRAVVRTAVETLLLVVYEATSHDHGHAPPHDVLDFLTRPAGFPDTLRNGRGKVHTPAPSSRLDPSTAPHRTAPRLAGNRSSPPCGGASCPGMRHLGTPPAPGGGVQGRSRRQGACGVGSRPRGAEWDVRPCHDSPTTAAQRSHASRGRSRAPRAVPLCGSPAPSKQQRRSPQSWLMGFLGWARRRARRRDAVFTQGSEPLAQRRAEEAERILGNLVRNLQAAHHAADPRTMEARKAHAEALLALDRPADAASAYATLVAERRQAYGDDDARVLAASLRLNTAQLLDGRDDEAGSLARTTIADFTGPAYADYVFLQLRHAGGLLIGEARRRRGAMPTPWRGSRRRPLPQRATSARSTAWPLAPASARWPNCTCSAGTTRPGRRQPPWSPPRP